MIEGSALGGQVIARKLAKTFPDHAHRFFNLGHGNAHPSWKDFQAMLDISLADSSARRVAVAQARTMFDLFHSMLETLSADAMAMPGQLPTRDLRTQAVDRLSGS